jgi:L-ribulose-5-phosphate 3-epimerase
MAHSIGIMQGRLVPPVKGRIQAFPSERWRDEFALARRAGLQAIEWIYDLEDADTNPLATDSGVAEMHKLSAGHGVSVKSLCADYFMARTLIRAAPAEKAQRLAKLIWLLERCQACGIERVVLPFVDASKIENQKDEDEAVEALQGIVPELDRLNLELHLETSLSPADFRRLLERLPHPRIRVNYDSGNSASLGYAPREEWAAYGPRIGSVHIKDRVSGGGTVPLGTGSADFPALFQAVREFRYRGPWILQVVRGEPGGEVAWAGKNKIFLLSWLEKI